MLTKQIIITIDGPASSGKGSIASILALKLNFKYLNSGAIYRTLAFIALQEKIFYYEIEKLLNIIPKLQELHFIDDKIILNGMDISRLILQEEIGLIASEIAQNQKIRTKLINLQRNFTTENLITDGRDMGTTIFPTADLKIFLTASVSQRAKRRYQQLLKNNFSIAYEEVLIDIIKRDKLDYNRLSSPLTHNLGALFIDNTDLNIDETVAFILNKYHNIKTT